jgi:hypothetical protein
LSRIGVPVEALHGARCSGAGGVLGSASRVNNSALRARNAACAPVGFQSRPDLDLRRSAFPGAEMIVSLRLLNLIFNWLVSWMTLHGRTSSS